MKFLDLRNITSTRAVSDFDFACKFPPRKKLPGSRSFNRSPISLISFYRASFSRGSGYIALDKKLGREIRGKIWPNFFRPHGVSLASVLYYFARHCGGGGGGGEVDFSIYLYRPTLLNSDNPRRRRRKSLYGTPRFTIHSRRFFRHSSFPSIFRQARRNYQGSLTFRRCCCRVHRTFAGVTFPNFECRKCIKTDRPWTKRRDRVLGANFIRVEDELERYARALQDDEIQSPGTNLRSRRCQ